MLGLLPVSGERISLRAPLGIDEVLLAESPHEGLDLKLEMASRLTAPVREGVSWLGLPVADLDAALLVLRAFLRGDRLVAEIDCEHCGVRGDLSFSIADYLKGHRPKPVRGLKYDKEGWCVLKGVRFRPPTVGWLLECQQQTSDEKEAAVLLEEACLKADGAPERRRARLALARVAPLLTNELEGNCHHCGGALNAWFEPGEFVLAELRQEALAVFGEVHLLASNYGWSEQAILAMPASRRTRYANMIASDLDWRRAQTALR